MTDRTPRGPARRESDRIGVSVRDGVVTIFGPGTGTRIGAAGVAMQSRRAGIERRTAAQDDVDVAVSIASALRHQLGRTADVTAVVSSGWVTLSGDVDWDHERRLVAARIWNVPGCCGLTNGIRTRHPPITQRRPSGPHGPAIVR